MAATTALFERRYPSLAGDPRIADELAAATLELDSTAWGSQHSEGVCALAAHRIEAAPLDGPNQVSDPIAGELVKPPRRLQVSPVASASDAVYLETRGGREFLRLRRSLPTAVFYGGVGPE